MKIGAIIVTYNPDIERLKKNINHCFDQVSCGYIVDNHSDNVESISRLVAQFNNFKIIKLVENFGIARAQNIGFASLDQEKCNWVLTLDQDTIVPNDYVNNLIPFLSVQNAGIVTGAYIDRKWNSKKIDEIRRQRNPEVQKIFEEISSGNLVSMSAWRDVCGFNDTLFIDYVDFDFDYKIIENGYLVYRINTVEFEHEIGEPINIDNSLKVRLLCLQKHELFDHSPKRLFYLNRNRIIVRRSHPGFGSPLRVCVREILNLREVFVMSGSKKDKFKESLRGIMHGVLFKI